MPDVIPRLLRTLLRTPLRSILPSAMLAGLLLTAGCKAPAWQDSPTMRTFESWVSRPFENLARVGSPSRFFRQETRHARHLTQFVPQLIGDEGHRGRPLMQAGRRTAGQTLVRTRRLSETATTTVRREFQEDRDRIAGLIGEDGTASRLLSPNRTARRFKNGLAQVPRLLLPTLPVLSARDDPDRQTGAEIKPSQTSFLQRLLRRIRL